MCFHVEISETILHYLYKGDHCVVKLTSLIVQHPSSQSGYPLWPWPKRWQGHWGYLLKAWFPGLHIVRQVDVGQCDDMHQLGTYNDDHSTKIKT